MPRATRIFLPGHVWHLTHRCHRRQFLLRFVRDRRAWRSWLFEARKRYGLSVLDYTATSNHVHLLVRSRGEGEIAAGSEAFVRGVRSELGTRGLHRKLEPVDGSWVVRETEAAYRPHPQGKTEALSGKRWGL